MTPYWILYFFVTITTVLCCVKRDNIFHLARPAFLVILFGVLLCFSGLRGGEVDADSLNYVDWFQEISLDRSTDFSLLKDPAFFFISKFVAYLGLGVVFLFLSYCVIALWSKFKFANYVSHPEFAGYFLYLYFCRFYFGHDMTQIRVGAAVGVASLALLLAVRHRAYLGFSLFLVAISFHLSVALLLPFFIAVAVRYGFSSRGPLLVMLLAAIIVNVYFEAIFQALGIAELVRVAAYLNGEYDVNEISLISFYFLIKIFVVGGLVAFRWKMLEYFDRMVVYLVTASIFFQVALASNDALALRSAEVFAIFDLALFIIPLSVLTRYYRLAYLVFVMVIGLGFFISSLKIMNPYYTIWN